MSDACMHMCMCMCVPVHMYIWPMHRDQRRRLGVLILALRLIHLSQSPTEPEVQTPVILLSLHCKMAEVIDAHMVMFRFLCRCWGFELRSTSLYNKYSYQIIHPLSLSQSFDSCPYTSYHYGPHTTVLWKVSKHTFNTWPTILILDISPRKKKTWFKMGLYTNVHRHLFHSSKMEKKQQISIIQMNKQIFQ